MEYIASHVAKYSNYSIVNKNNIYNCFINILLDSDEETRKTIVKYIRLNIGMTFFNNLRDYIIRKFPDSEILGVFINR
jgi:hypothetical protein